MQSMYTINTYFITSKRNLTKQLNMEADLVNPNDNLH